MTCYYPMSGYVQANGGWGKKPPSVSPIELTVPCKKCIGCRLDYSREWAIRCVHEAQMHKENSYITLTYAPEHLPNNGSLNKRHFQLFIKKLRKYLYSKYEKTIRFYHCGEYGEKLKRPHYHALIFGHQFDDLELLKMQNKIPIYKSETLRKIWGKGHVSIGEVNFQSAAYVARYILKKVNGDPQAEHYENIDLDTGEIIHLQQEYVTMSRKPGIGKSWFDKYGQDIFPSDEVVLLTKDGSKKYKTPKYYTDLYQHTDPEAHLQIKERRKLALEKNKKDTTKERLAQRETIQQHKLNRLIRHKDEEFQP